MSTSEFCAKLNLYGHELGVPKIPKIPGGQ